VQKYKAASIPLNLSACKLNVGSINNFWHHIRFVTNSWKKLHTRKEKGLPFLAYKKLQRLANNTAKI
jgi:hypothetical protein